MRLECHPPELMVSLLATIINTMASKGQLTEMYTYTYLKYLLYDKNRGHLIKSTIK